MNVKKLNMLATRAIYLSQLGEDVALRLTDDEAKYFLGVLDNTGIVWATGEKPSKYKYYKYGRNRLLWIIRRKHFQQGSPILFYGGQSDYVSRIIPLSPDDIGELSNFRRYA